MKSIHMLVLIIFGGLIAACATIIDGGPTRPVSITSEPGGLNFKIEDLNGKVVHSGTTPETVNLRRSDGTYFGAIRYKVTLDDSGKSENIESRVTAWYIAGNIMFGGLIGWLIVDPITGAMYSLQPSEVDFE